MGSYDTIFSFWVVLCRSLFVFFSCGHCIVCPFWLLLWYLFTTHFSDNCNINETSSTITCINLVLVEQPTYCIDIDTIIKTTDIKNNQVHSSNYFNSFDRKQPKTPKQYESQNRLMLTVMGILTSVLKSLHCLETMLNFNNTIIGRMLPSWTQDHL